ncbi:Helicase, C-terminal:Type III restriction enzyme, res subunit:DEAD/DEAH box helicase [Bradyrhizobium sp. ORS 375]|uniref:DEAD/DEAH box helicase n=1 Tax=Bradyrhizobium sp. (strain ORS 375) TaxID=566679 RepID=UPI000240640A|nr:DEAD/DEAH box helicase [Bradyrhizobium sp. ORS 375]CCD94635.1 Helicase, C-terminal:Type III restriction enzyme, res subunit:DEAD/DEAH box helicase [Bradyrhizobium sp. ORS 375]
MAFQLRYYQRDAINAVYDYWTKKPDGNPLIVIPTGGGKSPVLGTITEEMIGFEPQTRIVMATHVSELIEQNYAELMGLWPFAPAGIFSAGLRRRDAHSQIIFGGIQTMWRHADRIGHVDLLIIDEAHMLPPDAETMYGKFIAALKRINPRLLILGLTATPYRTNSGMLTDGDDAMFDAIVYEISIRELIEKGFLCPLVSKATATAKTMVDLSKLRRAGGEFTDKSLKAVFDKSEVTEAAVDEIIGFASSNERPRKSWLLFCAGVEHALHVRDAIRARGYSSETIHGGTDKGERTDILEALKAGKLTSVTNFGVLTTGTNIKRIDLIALLRATDSTQLYVQMCGRGTRLLGDTIEESIRNGKEDCLVLDFGGNVRRHGPIDCVQIKKPGKGAGEAPVKECPQCHSLIFAGLSECPDCGHKFERDPEKNIKQTADVTPIMSTSKPDWVPVKRRTFFRHDKPGGTPSIRVEYLCGSVSHKEWICPEHQGFARVKFEKWWRQHTGNDNAPFSIQETFDRAKECRETNEIMIKANGKHWEIVARKLGEIAPEGESKSSDSVMPPRDEMIALNYQLNGKPERAAEHRAAVAARKPWQTAPVANDNSRAVMPGHVKPAATVRATAPWNAQITPPLPKTSLAPWDKRDLDLDDDIPF